MALSKTAIEWLKKRRIDPELAVKLGLDSYTSGDGGEGISIPYFVGNRVVNHKRRGLFEKRYYQDKGAIKCFWNYNVIIDQTLADEPLIFTEGEFDAMAAIQCGYVRTVSVPDGATAVRIAEDEQSRKYGYVEHAEAGLRECREIILATDGDEPGQNLMNDLAVRLGKAKCKWVRYPSGCKDLNDVLIKYGERGVHEFIRNAQWCQVDGLYRMSELPPYPTRERFSTGMEFLDRHFRIRMGDFSVLTGRPGDGKTTFVNDLICHLAENHGWTIAVASFEQHPQADHRRALRQWFCRAPLEDGTGRPLVDDETIAKADRWIDEHFVFIVPSDDDFTNLKWVLDKCAAAVIRYGARMVVIDPWNELDHDRPNGMSLTEYTGKAIKEFKLLARRLDTHVMVVAHPTKLAADEKPGLYSISDSAHWANKPDVGLVIWKPSRESDRAEITVAKSKYHDQIGRPGSKWMTLNTATLRYVEAAPPASKTSFTRKSILLSRIHRNCPS